MGKKTRRLSPEQRKAQIVEVTLDVIRQYGVKGASMARIADRVGVTAPALYVHFENREALLRAALDSVFEMLFALRTDQTQGDALKRLRDIGIAHRRAMSSSAETGYAQPLFQFIAATSEEGLRHLLKERQLESIRQIALIVEEGQREGTISQDLDPEQVAWMLESSSWGIDAGYVMGIEAMREGVIGQRLLEALLDSISTPSSRGCGEDTSSSVQGARLSDLESTPRAPSNGLLRNRRTSSARSALFSGPRRRTRRDRYGTRRSPR